MMGAGRALPHKGLRALHPWNSSAASRSALMGSKKALILFIWDRTTGWRAEWGYIYRQLEFGSRRLIKYDPD